MNEVTTIGIDLAKNVFELHGVNQRGRSVLRKTVSRSKLLPLLVNIPPCLIGIEACGGAYYWARETGIRSSPFLVSWNQSPWIGTLRLIPGALPKRLDTALGCPHETSKGQIVKHKKVFLHLVHQPVLLDDQRRLLPVML
jgi:hypothetical protein